MHVYCRCNGEKRKLNIARTDSYFSDTLGVCPFVSGRQPVAFSPYICLISSIETIEGFLVLIFS